MAAINPLGVLGVAGAAALVMFGGTKEANAKPAPKPGEPGGLPGSSLPGANSLPPNAVLQRVLSAVQSGDPAVMRAEADKLEREGYAAQAADLRGAAAQIERATGGGKPPGSSGLPPLPTGGGVPLPPLNPTAPVVNIPTTPAQIADPQLDLAGRTALMLNMKGRGREDKPLVAKFQTQETATGYYTGKIDGLYGPKSALALAKHWAIIPPKPYYWPKAASEAAKAKTDYRGQLLAIAAKDTPRADEWSRAAEV
jgi:hypothetical protein